MRSERIDHEVRAVVGARVPGLVLVVVGPEGVRARVEVGQADLATGRPMTGATAMPWFSMTKIATATVAVRLAERGVIDLDEPLARLVPAVARMRPAAWAQRITARHALQHTAGLPNPIPVRWVHPADRPGPDPDDFLAGLLARHRRLRREPGRRAAYSNLGYLVLGAALARATGRRFDELLVEEVLGPLGMVRTAVGYPPGVPAASGYHPGRRPDVAMLPRWARGPRVGRWLTLAPFLVDGAAYGGLVGPADDAALLARAHLAEGRLEGVRLLPADAAVAMRTIGARGRRLEVGLGWFVPSAARRADPPFVEHLGGGAGFFDVMRLYPTRGVAAVVMGNATSYPIDAVARLALRWAD